MQDNTRPMPVHPWQGNDNAGVDSDVGIENNKVDNYFANPSSFSSVVIAAQVDKNNSFTIILDKSVVNRQIIVL